MWFGKNIKVILIITSLFPPEPVVSAGLAFDLASSLAEKETVVVLSPKPTRPHGMTFMPEEKTSYPFEHIVQDSYTCSKSNVLGRLRESYSFGIYLKKYIKENHKNIEVIYANIWPLFAQRHLADVASQLQIPFVLHVQDIYPESISKKIKVFGAIVDWLLMPLDRQNLQKAKKIVTISNQMKSFLIETRGLDKSKVEVIRNWQNDKEFTKQKRKQLLEKNEKFTFMYLGSINPTANVDLLIRAFGPANQENARLIVAGDGPEKSKCIELAKSYDSDIQFIEASPDQVPSIQSKADVLLLPLKKGVAGTALPSKLTAYMFSKKPIICSIDEDSEAAEIIRNNDCGWVVEPENEQALIVCMRDVLKVGKGVLGGKAENSYSYAKNNLSQEGNLKKLVSVVIEAKKP